jgi:GNAT superfamily N-acetyltransferase
MDFSIIEIDRNHTFWKLLLEIAPRINEATIHQLNLEIEWALSDHIMVALSNNLPVGVLRLVTQRIGEDEERPPIVYEGKTLNEGKVISFGVLPGYRRAGIGRALQERAIEISRYQGCYQLRSRSKYTYYENFQLKISMGCCIQPSLQDNSVYFIYPL